MIFKLSLCQKHWGVSEALCNHCFLLWKECQSATGSIISQQFNSLLFIIICEKQKDNIYDWIRGRLNREKTANVAGKQIYET